MVDVDHEYRRRAGDLLRGQRLVAVVKRPAVPQLGQRVAKRELLEHERAPRLPTSSVRCRCRGLCQTRLQTPGDSRRNADKATELDPATSDLRRQLAFGPATHNAVDGLGELLGVGSVDHPRAVAKHRGDALATDNQLQLRVTVTQRPQLTREGYAPQRHRNPERDGHRMML